MSESSSGICFFYFIGNFSEIPYETITLREDAHDAERKRAATIYLSENIQDMNMEFWEK